MDIRDEGASARPVDAKALLVDPSDMRVTWANEAVTGALAPGVSVAEGNALLSHVVPMADALGAAEVVRDVAATGEARHLNTSLVSTGRGVLDVVVSVYRLPAGEVLVVIDSTFKPGGRSVSGAGRRR